MHTEPQGFRPYARNCPCWCKSISIVVVDPASVRNIPGRSPERGQVLAGGPQRCLAAFDWRTAGSFADCKRSILAQRRKQSSPSRPVMSLGPEHKGSDSSYVPPSPRKTSPSNRGGHLRRVSPVRHVSPGICEMMTLFYHGLILLCKLPGQNPALKLGIV